MRVRKAAASDLGAAVGLAERLGLDYPGMEDDALWVAEERGAAVGLVALKKHADCLELCALGVDPIARNKGAGKALVEALMAEARGPVHLATVIPAFFESCGFVRTADVPAAFAAKRRTSWCDGCDPACCTVMLREPT